MNPANPTISAPQHPKIDHFKLHPDIYLAFRRYLGTMPHDEVTGIIKAMDSLPAVTDADIKTQEKRFKNAADNLKKLAEAENEIMASRQERNQF